MSRDIILDQCGAAVVALSLLASVSAGCGNVRNPSLERARNAYARA
jgi:hypothetical protein